MYTLLGTVSAGPEQLSEPTAGICLVLMRSARGTCYVMRYFNDQAFMSELG